MSKKIVLFYDDQLPVGSANATRIVSFAHIFRKAGYDVVMLGINYNDSPRPNGLYEEIPYQLLSFPEMHCTGVKSFKRRRHLKINLKKWLNDYKERKGLDFVFYSSRNGLASFFVNFSKETNIPVIYNHVEWHLLSMFSGKFGVFSFIQNRYELHFVLRRIKNIVAISSLLQEYYDKQGCHTIRIPTIINLANYPDERVFPSNSKLILAYAGKPGKKDAILNVVKAINLLGEDKNKIEFRIYGINEEQLKKMGYLNEEDKLLIGKQVYCMGRIPYDQVQKELRKADFTILLRKNWRNANAGFPTKVGESMAAGVPVIANLTSDIGLYLHDEVEGLVCANESPEACAVALQRALKLSVVQKKKMRISARRQAEKGFNYETYVVDVNKYLCRVSDEKREK